MRRFPFFPPLMFALASLVSPAFGWWDGGHMQIAYVAYEKLDAPVKEKVDALLRLNKDYAKWTAGAPDEKTAKLYAFVHAATWADDIKTKEYNYTRDNANSPAAGQNTGYVDRNQHAYWHFKDIKFSPDGTPVPAPDPVDLVIQLKLMIAALPAASGASDDVRSYVIWLGFFILWVTRISRSTRSAGSRNRFRMATQAATPNWLFRQPARPLRSMLTGTACSADIFRLTGRCSTLTTKMASRKSPSMRLPRKLPIRRSGLRKVPISPSNMRMHRQSVWGRMPFF